MTQSFVAYSFRDVQAAIVGPGGAFSLGSDAGVAEEGITIEMLDDKDTMVIGADGTPMHSLHAGQGATASFRLLKTSSNNALLSVMYNLQTLSSSNWGQNTIVITDLSRGDVATCLQASFRRWPNNTYAKDGNILEWAFNVGKYLPMLGVGTLVAA